MYISNFTPCYIFCLLSSHAWLFSWMANININDVISLFDFECLAEKLMHMCRLLVKQHVNNSRCTSALCSFKAGVWTRLLSAYIRNMGNCSFLYLDSYLNLFFYMLYSKWECSMAWLLSVKRMLPLQKQWPLKSTSQVILLFYWDHIAQYPVAGF